jgi:hypothetical protein
MDAFIKLIGTMDDLVAEFQIDSNGLIEKNYKVKRNPETGQLDSRLIHFMGLLASYVPESLKHSEYPIETVSYHPADGITYVNPTVVVVYECDPPKEIISTYGIPDRKFVRGGFAIKYDLVTGNSIAKLSDLNYENFQTPKLPLFTKIGTDFGVGVHFSNTDTSVQKYADFYVASPFGCRWLWTRMYGDLYPQYKEDFIACWRAYSVQTDTSTNQVVKLKRYIYWNDKPLMNLMRA